MALFHSYSGLGREKYVYGDTVDFPLDCWTKLFTHFNTGFLPGNIFWFISA